MECDIFFRSTRECPLDRIEDFQAFLAIVEKGSLTAAAKQLGRSLQSVSRSLAALEGDLGVELVARTTRRSAATEAGLAFYRRVGAALSEIEAAKLETANHSSEAAGLLRIASSTVFAPLYVVPAVSTFLKLHPKVDVELDLSDSCVDLIENGYDLAIRLGELPDSSREPGGWPISAASCSQHLNTSPNAAAHGNRRISSGTNVSSALRYATAMPGHSLLAAGSRP